MKVVIERGINGLRGRGGKEKKGFGWRRKI